MIKPEAMAVEISLCRALSYSKSYGGVGSAKVVDCSRFVHGLPLRVRRSCSSTTSSSKSGGHVHRRPRIVCDIGGQYEESFADVERVCPLPFSAFSHVHMLTN